MNDKLIFASGDETRHYSIVGTTLSITENGVTTTVDLTEPSWMDGPNAELVDRALQTFLYAVEEAMFTVIRDGIKYRMEQ